MLASTNGTILPDIFSADYQGKAEFCVLLTNKNGCGARKKAEKKGIPSVFLSAKGKTREEWDAEAIHILQEYKADLVILVGFMRILSPIFVSVFPECILNIHPSLLPKFAGGMDTDVHAEVLRSKETETGATVHIVTEELDAGPIILQKSTPVFPDDTPETLKNRVQSLEKEILPEAIRRFLM
ncbi:phosphoribosylglycinamide formyltransferase [Candidatus Peregrinibacteria bacterium]|nr:MAG: phosphoribosylglycinamide formyltransferase [Candidatus Peregrinibacteria bacterium]